MMESFWKKSIQFVINREIITDNRIIAESFNEYFFEYRGTVAKHATDANLCTEFHPYDMPDDIFFVFHLAMKIFLGQRGFYPKY